MSFLNMNTREGRIECFDCEESGDGASCLAGHLVVSIFSLVERKPNSKISIFIYPKLQRISRCVFLDKINILLLRWHGISCEFNQFPRLSSNHANTSRCLI